MKQKDLADKLDLSASHLNEIERGRKQVTLEVLQKYADYFKIPASSLLYFAEAKDGTQLPFKPNPIAPKAIQMLHWLETITKDAEDDDEEKVPN